MKLIGNTIITFGGITVTQQAIDYYHANHPGCGVGLYVGTNDRTNEDVLYSLLAGSGTTPFTIAVDEMFGDLSLEATLGRFPFSVNSDSSFEAFGVRLMPTRGRVKSVTPEGDGIVGFNTFLIGVNRLVVDVGSFHTEIFFQHTEDLPGIVPHGGFQEVCITNSGD